MKKLNNPLVSLIIVNFNGIAYTRKCLRSLNKTTYSNFEIMLVDNDSDNDEIGQLKKEFGKFINQAVANDQNIGFPRAVNQAAKKSKAKYIALLNNDLEFDPNWLAVMVEIMEKDKKIAAVGPKLLNKNLKGYFEYAYAAGGFLDIFGYPFTRGRIFDTIEKDKNQYNDQREVFWFPGGAGLIRRDIFLRFGGYEPSFFMYAEESDLCWKIWQAGLKVVCEPKSIIYHYGGVTNQKLLTKKLFYIHRNNFLTLLRNMPIQNLIYLVPLRIVMEYITALKYLKTPILAWTVVKAQLVAWANFSSIIKNRRKYNAIIKKRTIPKTIYKKSIVLQYYLFGKKRFNDLNF